jgi:hypothetical protein
MKSLQDLGYDDDAAIWIKRLLEDKGVAFRGRLTKAISMAAGQLELIKPAVMGVGARGFYGGPVAMVQRGALVVVLANPRGVVTISLMKPPAGFSREEVIDESVRCATAQFIDLCKRLPSPNEVANLIDIVVREYGALPGKAARKQFQSDNTSDAIGLLFGAMPTAERHKMLEGIETVVDNDVCPALIGLVGPAASGRPNTICAVWPLLMPLAKYFEQVTGEQLGSFDGDARR